MGVNEEQPSVDRDDDRPFDSVPVPDEFPSGWRAVEATGELRERAALMEYEVFVAEGYCRRSNRRRVMELDDWDALSSFQVVLSDRDELQGTVRLMFGRYDELPIGAFERSIHLPPDPVLEYSTLAVPEAYRRSGVADWLYRAVWQQALRFGAAGMVAIGERWLQEVLNDGYDLGFIQLGPSRYYMGGDCFPMGSEFSQLIRRLKRQPSFFRWAAQQIDLRDLPEPAVREAVAAVLEGPPTGSSLDSD